MELAEYRKQQAAKPPEGDTPPEPTRVVYRVPLPIDKAKLEPDSPLHNLISADEAAARAEETATQVANAIDVDPRLSAEGRAARKAEVAAEAAKSLAPFDEPLKMFGEKIEGERVSLLKSIIGEHDAGRAARITEYIRDKVDPRERLAFYSRLSGNGDAEALAAIIDAPRAFDLIADDKMRERLTERLLELRGGEQYDELKQREQALGIVRVNREAVERRIRERLLDYGPPATDEASIRSRLVKHNNE